MSMLASHWQWEWLWYCLLPKSFDYVPEARAIKTPALGRTWQRVRHRECMHNVAKTSLHTCRLPTVYKEDFTWQKSNYTVFVLIRAPLKIIIPPEGAQGG